VTQKNWEKFRVNLGEEKKIGENHQTFEKG
jgi:hypothetical protein